LGKAYILDNHDEEGKLDPQGLLGISRARDVVGRHVCAHDLEHRRLNVLVCDTLDVSIADCGVRIWYVRKPQGIGVCGREGGRGALGLRSMCRQGAGGWEWEGKSLGRRKSSSERS